MNDARRRDELIDIWAWAGACYTRCRPPYDASRGRRRSRIKVQDDGALHWLSDSVALDPNIDFKGQTWGHVVTGASHFTGCSRAAFDVAYQDFVACATKYAVVRELPQAFFDLMAADLDGPIAQDYRGYIKHQVKPVLDSIKDVLYAHYAAIEVPSQEWLIETFPGHGKADSANHFQYYIVAYARAWDRVLAEWEAGRLVSG
eukprot:SAG22_NODE_818_length_7026_cov_4.805399_3_plen_202_part_00